MRLPFVRASKYHRLQLKLIDAQSRLIDANHALGMAQVELFKYRQMVGERSQAFKRIVADASR